MSEGLSVDQNKWLERVNTAGKSTEALGWLVLFLAPIGPFIQNFSFVAGLILWLLTAIVGVVLIFAGKYVMHSDGYHNTSVLWLILVLSLLFIGGIIPLIVSVEAVIGLIAFSKLKSELGLPERTGKELPVYTVEVVALFLFIVIGITVLFSFRTTLDDNASKANSNSLTSTYQQ